MGAMVWKQWFIDNHWVQSPHTTHEYHSYLRISFSVTLPSFGKAAKCLKRSKLAHGSLFTGWSHHKGGSGSKRGDVYRNRLLEASRVALKIHFCNCNAVKCRSECNTPLHISSVAQRGTTHYNLQPQDCILDTFTTWAVIWGGAKRMGGGKRTRERALPKIFGPLQKSFWSALSWIFLQEIDPRGVENVPYEGGSKTPFWEGCHS